MNTIWFPVICMIPVKCHSLILKHMVYIDVKPICWLTPWTTYFLFYLPTLILTNINDYILYKPSANNGIIKEQLLPCICIIWTAYQIQMLYIYIYTFSPFCRAASITCSNQINWLPGSSWPSVALLLGRYRFVFKITARALAVSLSMIVKYEPENIVHVRKYHKITTLHCISNECVLIQVNLMVCLY